MSQSIEEVPVTPAVVAEEEPKVDFASQLDTLVETISSLDKELSDLSSKAKAIEKTLKKLKLAYRKESKKKSKKPKSVSNNHGFNAAVSISKELADFLGLPVGSRLRRPEVTGLISKYASDNGLKNAENKGIYNPDKRLKKLFGPATFPLRSDKTVLGYDMFNLQKYMKPHFQSTPPV